MKKVSIIIGVIILYISTIQANDTLPTLLNVVAPSGLKLRANPGSGGEVLTIIPSKSVVLRIDNELHLPVEDEINYIRGEWIYISYLGEEGYVFDGFLSRLPIPIHEFEKTQFDLDLIYPLESWMEYHQLGTQSYDTVGSDLFTKVTHHYDNGNLMEKKNTEKYYRLKVTLHDANLWEAYHLLSIMLNSKDELTTFQNKSLFISNKEGIVDKIKIRIEDPVEIRQVAKGKVEISITSFGKGCTFDITRL